MPVVFEAMSRSQAPRATGHRATLTNLCSYPLEVDTWRAYASNGYGGNVIMRLYATCLRTTPAGANSGSGNDQGGTPSRPVFGGD